MTKRALVTHGAFRNQPWPRKASGGDPCLFCTMSGDVAHAGALPDLLRRRKVFPRYAKYFFTRYPWGGYVNEPVKNPRNAKFKAANAEISATCDNRSLDTCLLFLLLFTLTHGCDTVRGHEKC